MTQEQAKEMLPFIQAIAEGKEVIGGVDTL